MLIFFYYNFIYLGKNHLGKATLKKLREKRRSFKNLIISISFLFVLLFKPIFFIDGIIYSFLAFYISSYNINFGTMFLMGACIYGLQVALLFNNFIPEMLPFKNMFINSIYNILMCSIYGGLLFMTSYFIFNKVKIII